MRWSFLAGLACARLFAAPARVGGDFRISHLAVDLAAPVVTSGSSGPAPLPRAPAASLGAGAAVASAAVAAALAASGLGQRARLHGHAALALEGAPLERKRVGVSRRALLGASAASLLPSARVRAMEGNAVPATVNLEDLPPGASTAYKQYWTALQLAADFYVFELKDNVLNPQRWDLVGGLMEGKSIGSAQSPSRIEREFIGPMRVLSLAFPPDLGGDEMADALGGFQKAMNKLGKSARSTEGVVTEAPSKSEVAKVFAHWDAGRVSLNAFFDALNKATESKRLVTIPVDGTGYPRSKTLYTQLKKDAALCRNRGGANLAEIGGLLLVYGTVPGVNPCGNVNMATYFNQ